MSAINQLGQHVLDIDCPAAVARIAQALRDALSGELRRQGLVVAMSGGIDSSVVAALCVEAVGRGRVLALLMPEQDSSADTLRLSRLMADHLGVETLHEPITPILEAVGCYRRQAEAIQAVIPAFGPDWKAKIVRPGLLVGDSYRMFSVVAQPPDGPAVSARLTAGAYLRLVAATNFKQRVRKMLEYYHADRLNYAVTGTPNRLEYDQGFFVKLGDGAADVKPIAHLYKTQVYRLAAHLAVPFEIRQRPPSTDTYSMPQSQEEFYFSLPYDQMDLCLYGRDHDLPSATVAAAIGLTPEQVTRVYRDIDRKRSTTRYQHLAPILVEPVPSVSTWRERESHSSHKP